MSHPDLFVVSIVRALVEVAMLALLGQGAVGLLSGARRASNPVYQLFRVVTQPVVRALRWLLPRQIVDRHVPVVAFFALFWLWIALAYTKRVLCQLNGLTNC